MTALGLNNYGKQVYRYGLEYADVDEKGEEVFRESDSTFFCRVRDLFANELKAMYNTLESRGAWHGESFINECDAWQNEFPEELWRLDIERKYIRTYNSTFINGAGDAQFLVNMCNGKMKYHRREWERKQEKYMASKYQSSLALSDNSVFRCTVPQGNLVVPPNYRLRLTPSAYMYLNVMYAGQSPIQVRAVPNQVYEIPYDGDKADLVNIYSASLIQDFGDMSPLYVATADTTRATKVKRLIFGNSTEGYDNPNFYTLTTGANTLLEVLDIQNVSGLTQALNLSALKNLRELYAHNSNISGVTFADGGKIETAELPAINSMVAKNLMYLTDLDIQSYNNMTNLVIENCSTIDVKAIINACTNINRVRLINVDLTLENTELLDRLYRMSGIDGNGYNVPQSVLTGSVYVPVIRQQQLYEFREAWKDLDITYGSMIEQFTIRFLNYDNTVLDVQYVDIGGNAVNPITRPNNPIEIPTKPSTISTDFTFDDWDSEFTNVFTSYDIRAVYSESVRQYTIRYVSNGVAMQETTGNYGDIVPYEGNMPTYDKEESAYRYCLFDRWDKSGLIDGDKTVNAIFDTFNYTSTAFVGRSLSSLRPVEIYALSKLGLENTNMDIQYKDSYTFNMGSDVEYDDIESEVVIEEPMHFNGRNYYDSNIKLLDEDKDFTLAIDFRFDSGNTNGSVLAQCYQSNGSNGFRLGINNGVKATWGTSSVTPASANEREILVIRHKKGDSNVYVYTSNLSGMEVVTTKLTKPTVTSDSTLVFGCSRADDGAYENHASGSIYWAKVWYSDLGEATAKKLAGWIHESISMEVSGFKKYYLTENPSKRCMFTLLASHLLYKSSVFNRANTTVGGWASSYLKTYLNERMYKNMPDHIRSLVKQVTIYSTIGGHSSEISSSQNYVFIPSAVEVDSGYAREPYSSEDIGTIPYMINNEARKRAKLDGDAIDYWLRSPDPEWEYYMNRVTAQGNISGFVNASTSSGVLIELAF